MPRGYHSGQNQQEKQCARERPTLLSHKIMVCMYVVCVSVSHDYASLSMFFISVYVHVCVRVCTCVLYAGRKMRGGFALFLESMN